MRPEKIERLAVALMLDQCRTAMVLDSMRTHAL